MVGTLCQSREMSQHSMKDTTCILHKVLSFEHALCKLSEPTDIYWTPVSIIHYFSKTLLSLRIHISKMRLTVAERVRNHRKKSKKMQKSMQHIKRKTDLRKGKVERKLLIQQKLNLKERSAGKSTIAQA